MTDIDLENLNKDDKVLILLKIYDDLIDKGHSEYDIEDTFAEIRDMWMNDI